MTTPLVKHAMAVKRSPRSDAVENRARVLAAAESVFAELGTTASTEEVASRAGVGIGTVFRHFPTKNALLEAVLERLMERAADDARERLDDPDPGSAFFAVLERLVDQAPLKKAVASGLPDGGLGVKQRTGHGSLREVLLALMGRAQKAKALRRDVGPEEVIAVVIAASRAAEHTADNRALQKRTVRIILDGLRAR